jgi:hypothetical protein
MNRRRERLSLELAQKRLKEIVAQLRDMEAELAKLSGSLPAATRMFEARAELGGVIRTVQTDLIADALTTLDRAAHRGIDELRSQFLQRQQWLRRNL